MRFEPTRADATWNNEDIQFKPKILAADHKPENLEVLVDLLEEFDVDIFTATDGERAAELSLKYEFALALVNVQICNMTGMEAVHPLCTGNQLPIILIADSDENASENMIGGFRSSAVDFLLKPVDPDILKCKVRVILDLFWQQKRLFFANQKLAATIKQQAVVTEELMQTRRDLEECMDRRLAELTASCSEQYRTGEMMRLLLDNVPLMICIIDGDGGIQFANPPFLAFTGSHGDLSGRSIEDIVADPFIRQLKKYADRAYQGQRVDFEFATDAINTGAATLKTTVIPVFVDQSVTGLISISQQNKVSGQNGNGGGHESLSKI